MTKFWPFLLGWLLLLSACALPRVQRATATPALEPTPAPSAKPTSVASGDLKAFRYLIAEVVEKVEPAVVAIAVETRGADFFGRAVRQVGSGSGVIFDPQGFILTNNHVVEGAVSIQVTTLDGRNYTARLVGRDPLSDLAVVKIEGDKPFPAAALGDSDALRIGEMVIAIGNALALRGGPTVTLGVVGAKGRSVPLADVTLHDMVQTDAAINPGNSGGPLINLDGQVVGINTATSTEAPGIGFAVGTATAIPVKDQLLKNGRVIWPWLGIGVEDVTPAKALEQSLSISEGVLIASITRGGAAAQAGLLPKDVVVELSGQPVKNIKGLQALMRARKIGEQVDVTVVRGKDRVKVKTVLVEMPRGL